MEIILTMRGKCYQKFVQSRRKVVTQKEEEIRLLDCLILCLIKRAHSQGERFKFLADLTYVWLLMYSGLLGSNHPFLAAL